MFYDHTLAPVRSQRTWIRLFVRIVYRKTGRIGVGNHTVRRFDQLLCSHTYFDIDNAEYRRIIAFTSTCSRSVFQPVGVRRVSVLVYFSHIARYTRSICTCVHRDIDIRYLRLAAIDRCVSCQRKGVVLASACERYS